MPDPFHKRWLRVTAIVVGSFGPVFFLGTMAPTLAPARLTLDLLGWRFGQPSAYDSPDMRFLSALTGGFLLGCRIPGTQYLIDPGSATAQGPTSPCSGREISIVSPEFPNRFLSVCRKRPLNAMT